MMKHTFIIKMEINTKETLRRGDEMDKENMCLTKPLVKSKVHLKKVKYKAQQSFSTQKVMHSKVILTPK